MKRDFILVHGRVLNSDGGIGKINIDRLDYALGLMQKDGILVKKIIVAGNHGGLHSKDYEFVTKTRITTAHIMRDYLVSKGIDVKMIVLEPEGCNTWDCTVNAYNKIILPNKFKSGIIVSSQDHIPRVIMQTAQIFNNKLFGNIIFGGHSIENDDERADIIKWEIESTRFTLKNLAKFVDNLKGNRKGE